MASPVSVSPLLKTARWSLLLLGFGYGVRRNEKLKVKRAEERKVDIARKEKYLFQKNEALDKERREFERDSILFAKPEEGSK